MSEKQPNSASAYRGVRDRSIIERYEELLRDLINSISLPLEPWSVTRVLEHLGVEEKACKSLGVEMAQAWHLLTSALDLLGDTENAKSNFYRFGLAGPTTYNDVGEKYLRLYGLLNAASLQASAVKTLGRLLREPECRKRDGELEGLRLLHLRHVAGSHTIDFQLQGAKSGRKKAVFMVSQPSLDDEQVTVLDDQNKFEEYPLGELLSEWDAAVIEYLHAIGTAARDRLTESGSEREVAMSKELELLRLESQGELVTRCLTAK